MRLFGKKVVQLSHAERVSAAQQQAQEALGMFTTAHNQLGEANTELLLVANDAQAQAKELLDHAENAYAEIKMNKAVQDKLKDLVR